MARSAQPKAKSLAALAAALDTRKKALPGDARPAGVALRTAASRGADASRHDEPPRAPSSSSSGRAELARQPPRASPAPPPRLPGAGAPRSTVLASMHRPPAARPGTTPQAKGVKGKDEPRRRYPRAELRVRARLSLADNPAASFEATLPTVNISVGGLFLESTFFLKAGTVLLVELELPPKGRVVKVKGEVVRLETSSAHSGFAIRFTEYYDGSEVVLATHFLSPVLREFIVTYAKQHRFDASPEYIAHTADVLAAWELKKAELGGDVWNLAGEA